LFIFHEIAMPLRNDKQDPLRSAGDTGPLADVSRRPPPLPGEPAIQGESHKGDGPSTSPDGSGDLLLGAGAEFEGKLTFKGTVRIDAQFKGSITTNDVLIVGERARIDADITCGTVMIKGVVNGNIKAGIGVELHRSARARGDIETPSLWVENGALFNGAVKMKPVDRGAAAPSPAQSW
jgi:cytoskeletal protein CcmA (bactofilin family)